MTPCKVNQCWISDCATTSLFPGLTSARNYGKSSWMARWKLGVSGLIVLGSVIFIMLVIVVLPDVDLLDTAFQRGTAPVVIHSQATSVPGALQVPTIFQVAAKPSPVLRGLYSWGTPAVFSGPNFLPVFLSSLRR